MTATQNKDRDARRAKFNTLFESIAGTEKERVQKVCDILGYKHRSVHILRVKTKAWKVIPQSKLDILERELAREAAEKATL